MKQVVFLLILFASFAQQFVFAAEIIISDEDLQGGHSYQWTSDNTYILDGFVYLEAGGVLHIEAGTFIKGKSVPSDGSLASALIISKGAQIFAIGTAEAPVVFTAEYDIIGAGYDLGLNNRGLWGGLIILGDAPVSEDGGQDFIEGLPSSETRAYYGGSNANDNSGTLQYVSVRHAGAELEPDVEINGITLGGIGSETLVEHVEVVANLDDGIEIFGGTVSLKNIAIAYCGDECLDYDEGWTGNVQFLFAMIGTDKGDQPGEHDGSEATAGSQYDGTSFPHIYNATYIGPGEENIDVKCPRVLTFKSRGGGVYGNSIFYGFAKAGIQIEDKPAAEGDDSYALFLRDSIKVLNTIWMSEGWNSIEDIVSAESIAEDPTASALKTAMITEWSNTIEDPQLGGIDRGSYQFITEILGNGQLDPRPAQDGPAYQNLASYAGLPAFFQEVPFKGAFGSDNWARGWTALDEYGFFDSASTVDQLKEITEINILPNPIVDRAWLQVELETRLSTRICILDTKGREIKLISEGILEKGKTSIPLQLGALHSGLYFITIVSGEGSLSRSLVKL